MRSDSLGRAWPRWLAAVLAWLCVLATGALAQPRVTLTLSTNRADVGIGVGATYDIPVDVGDPQAFTLDWGDGSAVTLQRPRDTVVHGYQAPGVYTVSIRNVDNTPVASAVVTVVDLTACTIAASPSPAPLGATVTFTVTMTGSARSIYAVEFGDGGVSSPFEIGRQRTLQFTHAYRTPGVVFAVVRDTRSQSVVCRTTLSIQPPAATLTVNPNNVGVGDPVTASMTNLLADVDYTLDWGDGTTTPVRVNTSPSNATATHRYRSVGTFLVRLNANGLAPLTATVVVRAPAPTLSVTPSPASVGETVTATLGNLVAGLTYTLDWGDGATATVNAAASTATLTHVYRQAGTFALRLTSDGLAPIVVTLTVRLPAPTLRLTPNPAIVGETVTAALGNLVQGVAYTLDWGDGATQVVNAASASANVTKVFRQPGTYVVRLTADGIAPVVASLIVRVPVPTLSLTPNPAIVGETVTATIGNLVQGVAYTLDWGDDTSTPVTGNGGATAAHTYRAPGTYVVRLSTEGVAPVVVTLIVRLPTPTLTVAPNPATVGQQVVATIGGTVVGYPYRLDWGDDTAEAVTGGPNAVARHRFAQPGVYVVRLTAEGLPAPVTATVRVTPSLVVQSLTLRFTNPADRLSPVVATNARVDAALELRYSGQGQLQGDVLLDGTPIARAVLNAAPGRSSVVFPIANLPTDKVGTFTLSYQPEPAPGEPPVPATPAAIVYRVRAVPMEMDVGGFVFKLVNVTNLDPDAFTGSASHTLIVAGVEAFKDVGVTFSGLKVQDVSDTRVKVTDGTVPMDLGRFESTPLPAGIGGFTLKPARATFQPSGARFTGDVILKFVCTPSSGGRRIDPRLVERLESVPFSRRLSLAGVLPRPVPPEPTDGYAFRSFRPSGGQDARFSSLLRPNAATVDVALALVGALRQTAQTCRPDPNATFRVADATLAPDSGDLYGQTSASLNALSVPTTPLTLNGVATLTLDLSVSRSADATNDVRSLYPSVPAEPPPPDGDAWMGLVFTNVTPALGRAGAATTASPSAPAVPSLASTGPPTTATVRRGWTFAAALGSGVHTDRGWTFKVAGTNLTVVENTLVAADMQATADVPLWAQEVPVLVSFKPDGVAYAIAGEVTRDFGSTTLYAGSGAWIERADALDLVMNSSTWDIAGLSTLQPRTRPSGSPRFDGAVVIGNVFKGGQSANAAFATFVTSNASRLGNFALASRDLQSVSSDLQSAAGQVARSNTSSSGGFALTARTPLSATLQSSVLSVFATMVRDGHAPLGSIVLRVDGSAHFQGRAPSSDGLSRTPVWATDFKLFGQPFDIDNAVLGGAGGTYTLGLDGKQRLSPVVRAVPARARYTISNGRERTFAVRTDGFSQYVNADTTFRVEGSEQRVVLGARNFPVVASAQGGGGDVSVTRVDGGYELFLKGGLDMGSGGSAFSVTAEALFGLTSEPYFYVKAGVDSRAPIVSVLGAFNVYGFTGGVAYRMRWPDRATVPQYAQRPAKSPGSGIQVIGGLTGAFEDGNSLHFRSIFSVDERGFQLTADGWILTPMNQGVFGRQAPQSRILASITGDGFDMFGCLGPASIDGLSCGDLRAFTILDVVTFTSWMHVRIADQKFVKIGTYGNPSRATLQVPVLGGVTSTSYFIFGQAREPGDLPNNRTGTGLFVGYGFHARFGAAGALGRLGWPAECYPWARAVFQTGLDVNAGLFVNPVSFQAGVKFDWGLDVRAGCAGRDRPFANKQEIMTWNGRSFGFEIRATIEGQLQAYDPFAFDGRASLEIDLPIIPTFTVTANVSF